MAAIAGVRWIDLNRWSSNVEMLRVIGELTATIRAKGKTLLKYVQFGFRIGEDIWSKVLLSSLLPIQIIGSQVNRSPRTVFALRVRYGKSRFTLNLRSQDVYILHELFEGDGYFLEGLRRSRPKILLDFGSHIGISALQFSAKFPGVQIHCFEPDPNNLALLRANTKSFPNIEIHEEAVGPETGNMMFYVRRERQAGSSLIPRGSDVGVAAIYVRVRALDDVLSTSGPVDIVKFDIEGVEHSVFETSELIHLVTQIVGELKGSRSDLNAFLGLFPNHEAEVRYMGGNMYFVYLRLRK